MPFVLTADQIDSRRHGDLVDATLTQLASVRTRRPFLRTVGDELQGLLGEPASVVDAILILMRAEQWHIGLGLGPVTEPVPAETVAHGPLATTVLQVSASANEPPMRLSHAFDSRAAGAM